MISKIAGNSDSKGFSPFVAQPTQYRDYPKLLKFPTVKDFHGFVAQQGGITLFLKLLKFPTVKDFQALLLLLALS
ncbi:MULTISPECIES: hypothetical protein [unclassified Moorena]|uniref:hypothetical protein n=1 Tax=unclassified Moorena TaxID=2683338 RepID=UPI0013FCCB57|nr:MULTISPECIES: hypothetical protein [unclassified Moorena]NEP20591.1 hypothetical protein [Moorena sp. SIO3I6]